MNYKEKVEELEEKVTMMIVDYENGGMSNLRLLELIDNIERLGLGYRFHTHITRVLNKIAVINENSLGLEEADNDLYAVSLRFRLLRQHGYSVSQDLVRRFRDVTHGGLTGYPQTDVKTLLSIYEASYTGFDRETDLHEARLFATEHLLKINDHENDVMDHIYHALDVPLYRMIPRLEARWYIDAYGKRKDANQHLLDLAILDFNMVQSAHKRDLQEASKWWENLGLSRKLHFARDRVMECFFVSVAAEFDPQYSYCRVGLTKVCSLITILDDIYDVHGSLDELKVLTSAVKRWDIDAMKHMTEYLQVGFLALYNTVNEMGYTMLMSHGENIIPVLRRSWGELLGAFLVEAEWQESNYMPTLEQYLDNAWRSIAQKNVLTHGYVFTNQGIKKDATESLEKFADLFKWSSMISRLCNDLGTSTDEIARGKNLNAISCYMHENGVGEEVAREYVKTLRDEAWRKLIEARVACSEEATNPFVDMAVNLARFSDCVYRYGDEIGAPDARSKDRVLSVIIEPITFSS
jgi:isoprene synthase